MPGPAIRGVTVIGLLLTGCSGVAEPAGDGSGSTATTGPSPPPPGDPTTGPATTGPTSTDPGTTGTVDASSPSTTTDDTSTTTGESTGPTTTPEDCGDGLIQPPEQCDDGFEGNSNTNACTQTCKLAFCGDGLVHEGVEVCDAGADNNDMAYNGCTESCVPGPGCGDGIVQPQEECDGIDAADEAPCQPLTCKILGRLVFTTSLKVQGNFGGLTQADEICEAAAQAGGFDSSMKFKAWLSDGAATAAERLAVAAADPGYPYALRGGKLVAYDLDDLIEHGPRVPLDVDEFGATLPPEEYAWTNIHLGGYPYSVADDCEGWASASLLKEARVGKASPETPDDLPAWQAEFKWTSDTSQPCSYGAHFFCFED